MLVLVVAVLSSVFVRKLFVASGILSVPGPAEAADALSVPVAVAVARGSEAVAMVNWALRSSAKGEASHGARTHWVRSVLSMNWLFCFVGVRLRT